MYAFLLIAAAASSQPVVIASGLRNAKGLVRICLTRDRAHFPDCKSDPAAISRSFPASASTMSLGDVPAGAYAVAVFHDENGNHKLDKSVGIPREGFGFSRNPKIRFGPPKFDDVVVNLSPGSSRIEIRMHYLL